MRTLRNQTNNKWINWTKWTPLLYCVRKCQADENQLAVSILFSKRYRIPEIGVLCWLPGSLNFDFYPRQILELTGPGYPASILFLCSCPSHSFFFLDYLLWVLWQCSSSISCWTLTPQFPGAGVWCGGQWLQGDTSLQTFCQHKVSQHDHLGYMQAYYSISILRCPSSLSQVSSNLELPLYHLLIAMQRMEEKNCGISF